MSGPRTVLVTGASSGIGQATALRLAGAGWRVYAGVRRPGSGPSAPGITEVILDVTDPESVSAAAAGLPGLDALVNNAGFGQAFPVEHVSLHDLRALFEVNVFGVVAVTQAFLPLLRRSRGRIVNISSIGAVITPPFAGALAATKRAVESLSEALRMELRPAGIHVVCVRPASIHTPAADALAADPEALVAKLPPEGREHYGDLLRHFLKEMQESEDAGSPPDVVAQTVQNALEAAEPHPTYQVGKGASVLDFLGRWVPEEMRDTLLLKKLGLPTR